MSTPLGEFERGRLAGLAEAATQANVLAEVAEDTGLGLGGRALRSHVVTLIILAGEFTAEQLLIFWRNA
jgi:hypothetical protein